MKKIKRYAFIGWKCLWIGQIYFVLGLLCALTAIFDLDWRSAVYLWNDIA